MDGVALETEAFCVDNDAVDGVDLATEGPGTGLAPFPEPAFDGLVVATGVLLAGL